MRSKKANLTPAPKRLKSAPSLNPGAVKTTNPVRLAVDAVGGPLKAAVLMGVSLRTTYEWIRKGEIRLLKPALRLARASGMRVEEFGGTDGRESLESDERRFP